MKKVICLVLSVFMLISLASCSSKSDNADTEKGNGKITVVATLFPQYDAARAVGGDKINLTMLISPGSEAHYYEASLSDISKIQNCDLFIYNGGGGADGWVADVLKTVDTSEVKCIETLSLTTALEETDDGILTPEEEAEDDADEVEYDEHEWTSPLNFIKTVQAVCDNLCRLDPDNEDYYKSNADEYIAKLNSLDTRFRSIVEGASSNTMLFAERFPFRYFCEEYGLKYFAAFNGCSTESEPTLSVINTLIKEVQENNIKAIFYIEFSTETVADTICAATGAEKLLFHSCHNVSQEDFDNGITYVDLMEKNADNLEIALG